MIDYAYPCMMAEKALKDLHEAMLLNQHTQALDAAKVALAHIADILIAIENSRKQ